MAVDLGTPTVTTPDPLKKAQQIANDELGAPMNEEDRDRIFKYRAEPFLRASEKSRDELNRYFEGQGLRFASPRYERLLELEGQTYRNIGESVMVPQIERERAERRADIGLFAGLGGQEFEQEFREKEFGEGKRRFDVGLGFERERFGEDTRRFNVTTEQRADEFSKQLGLTRDQFDEAKRQYDLNRTDEVSRLEREFGLREGQLAEQIRQFNRQIELNEEIERGRLGLERDRLGAQKEQWAKEFGLTERQFDEAVRQFNEGTRFQNAELNERIRQFNQQEALEKLRIDNQVAQFAEQMGLSKDQFAEAKRQYDLGRTDELARLEREFGLREGQLAEQIRQFTEQMDLSERQQKFAEEAERTRSALEKVRIDNQADQFAASIGMEKERFLEAIRQFDAGQDLQDRELTERIKQFKQQMDLEVRRTDITELNAAMDRATARARETGEYVDPVTGASYQTLQRMSHDLEERVRRAAFTGWWEEDATIDLRRFYQEFGVDPSEFMNPPAGTTAPVGGDTGGTGGTGTKTADEGGGAAGGVTVSGGTAGGGTSTADEVVEKAREATDHTQRMVKIVERSRVMGVPSAHLDLISKALKPEDFDRLMDRLQRGESVTVGQLMDAFLRGGAKDPFQALFQLADYVTATGNGRDDTVTWIGSTRTADAAQTSGGQPGGFDPRKPVAVKGVGHSVVAADLLNRLQSNLVDGRVSASFLRSIPEADLSTLLTQMGGLVDNEFHDEILHVARGGQGNPSQFERRGIVLGS